jgi:hypothetical protein
LGLPFISTELLQSIVETREIARGARRCTATLARGAAGKRSWTGTLAATFPGEPPVSLVGPQFHTTLSRSFP